MSKKTTYLKLDTLEDVKTLICDILTELKDNEKLSEHSGKVVQLLQVWLKTYELGEIESLKARISRLEGNEEEKE
jgi:hypothetical protein